MINKLIISEAHDDPKGKKLFFVEAEFDYELRKTGFFLITDNAIEQFNFNFDRIYNDETGELITLIMNNLSDIKKLFDYPQYDERNRLILKEVGSTE